MAQNAAYLTLTDANFQDAVLENPQPVLVDFWAPWCGPCRVMAPVIEALATAFAGDATVGKVNVDDYPRLAAQYGIRSIPTLLVFKDGQIVDQAVGVMSGAHGAGHTLTRTRTRRRKPSMTDQETTAFPETSDHPPVDAGDISSAEHHPVVILGGGPAGLTAALYAARANLAPLVLQGAVPGGQLMTTTEVENYPGFTEGILGPDLMERLAAQAERFGAALRYGTVTAVHLGQRPFRLLVDDDYGVLADAVILATGATAKYLGLANERRLVGRGVSACATCDGPFFKGQEVAVVGGGDAALEEALFLTRFATRVSVIHRRDALRASQIMPARAFAHPTITFLWHTVVEDVLGEETVQGLRLRQVQTDARSLLPVQGLFVAIGHQPNTALFKGWIAMDDLGYLRTAPGSTQTSVAGVFAAGDVQDRVYRQAVTAAGSGAMAAIDAERWLAQHAVPETLQAVTAAG